MFLSLLTTSVIACGLFVFVEEQRYSVRVQELNESRNLNSYLRQASELLIDPNFPNDSIVQDLTIQLLTTQSASSLEKLATLDSTHSQIIRDVEQTLRSAADPWTLTCVNYSQRITLGSLLLSIGNDFAVFYYAGTSQNASGAGSQAKPSFFDIGASPPNVQLLEQIGTEATLIGSIDCPSNSFPSMP